jgi:hypothetical protein
MSYHFASICPMVSALWSPGSAWLAEAGIYDEIRSRCEELLVDGPCGR